MSSPDTAVDDDVVVYHSTAGIEGLESFSEGAERALVEGEHHDVGDSAHSTWTLAHQTIFWRDTIRSALHGRFDVVIAQPPDDETPVQRGQPMRHMLEIRDGRHQLPLLTGIVRQSARDTDAEEVAAQDTLYRMPPEYTTSSLSFFVCDRTISLFEVNTTSGSDTWECTKRDLKHSQMEAEFNAAILKGIFLVSRTYLTVGGDDSTVTGA